MTPHAAERARLLRIIEKQKIEIAHHAAVRDERDALRASVQRQELRIAELIEEHRQCSLTARP